MPGRLPRGLRGIDQVGELCDVIVSANGQPTLTNQLEVVGVEREIELSVKRKGRHEAQTFRAFGAWPGPSRLAGCNKRCCWASLASRLTVRSHGY